MTIQDLTPFMFSKERMDYLLTSANYENNSIAGASLEKPQKVIMPRSMLPPPPVGQPLHPIVTMEPAVLLPLESQGTQVKQTINYNDVKHVVKEGTKESATLSHIFFPKEKDKLFWCFYIMKHGLEDYKQLEYTNIIVEKKFKIEYIETLRTQKALLKAHKMAPLSHIENALLNEFRIDLKTFLALCVCEGLPMVYVHKNTYYELSLDDVADASTTDTHLVHQYDEPLKYGYCWGNREAITNSLYKIENLNKPLKAMSAYKSDELMEMCHKLGHKLIHKKNTKQELYEYVVQHLS